MAVLPITPLIPSLVSDSDIFWDENDASVFVVVAHTAYRACSPMELELKKANRIVVLDRTSRANWYFGVKGRYGKSGWFPTDVVVPVDEYPAFLENAAKVRGFENALRRLGRTANEPHSGGAGTQHLEPVSPTSPTSPMSPMSANSLSRSQSLPMMSPIGRRKRLSTAPSLSAFYCPLSGNLFCDPVVDIDGRTLEQQSFTSLYGEGTERLQNHTLRAAVEEVTTRQEANKPMAHMKPLIHVLDQHCGSIQKLEQRKRSLESKLAYLKNGNESLHHNCDVFRDIQKQPMWQVREAGGASDHWLIMLCRRLSHSHIQIPANGNELSDLVEDTLEDLIESSLTDRKKSMLIWSSKRGTRTREEMLEAKLRRRRSSMLASIFSFSSENNRRGKS